MIRTKSNKVTAKTIANLDKKFNYMILDKSDKPKKLRFSRYKTEKKHGTQIFDVKTKGLIDLLTHYIKDEKIMSGDYLFLNSKDEPYKKTWSGFVSDVFKKYTGKHIGANVLMHSFISDFLSSRKPPTLNKRAIAAYEMGQSISVQATYQYLPDEDDIIPMGDTRKMYFILA